MLKIGYLWIVVQCQIDAKYMYVLKHWFGSCMAITLKNKVYSNPDKKGYRGYFRDNLQYFPI